MNKLSGWGRAVVALALSLAFAAHARAGDLGVDVNADVDAFGHSQMDIGSIGALAAHGTVYPLPLINLPPGDHAHYWDGMVEQYQSAQIDFVAVWLKGNNQPATFANLVTAINKQGLGKRIKIMPFDDNPASWTALWNNDHGSGYGYKSPFDVSVRANWAWVWDRNLKTFFQSVPDTSRYKIDGRPVYRIWSGAPAFLSHLDGSGSKLLMYLRAQCRHTFGFNPYIIVPEDWVKNDPSSGASGIVDAVAPWFTPVPGPNYSTWNINTWHGVTLGACIPQFRISSNSDPNAPTWIVDPQHGKTLATGLAGTAGSETCAATFVEGFDDYWENATLWRARNQSPDGGALGYAQTGYDYPNQRINLLRRYSRNPFPPNLKEEAAGCDTYSGAVSASGPLNIYRNGSLAVEDTTDMGGGYDVCPAQAGQTLQWRDVPMQGTVHLLARAAGSIKGGRMHAVVDGMARAPVAVPKPSGGQAWTTVDLGAFVLARGSYHAVALVCDTPGLRVHWWQARTLQIPDGAYKIVAWPGPDPLRARKWSVHGLGGGRYSIRLASAQNRAALPRQWTIMPRPDGFFAIAPARVRSRQAALSLGDWDGFANLGSQEWSFVPVP